MNVFRGISVPYTGNEPYLHLCFSEASAGKVRAFLRRLHRRGVRVWYCRENPAGRKARAQMEQSMLGARTTLVYLDEAFRNDPAAKSRLLTCQQSGQPVICLNTDGGDGGLSIGLHTNACEIRLGRNASAGEAENALLRAAGFSQELIGEPVRDGYGVLPILSGLLIVLTLVAILAGIWWFLKHRSEQKEDTAPQTEAEKETLFVADEALREMIRDALGGGDLTAENLQRLTTLRLSGDTLPADLSDLSRLPALKTIELSQLAAKEIASHPELAVYTIELYGGAAE